TGVLRCPRGTAIVRPKRAGGRHADDQAREVRGIEADRVHHQAAGPGDPLLARRMIRQRFDLAPLAAAVVAYEERTGVDAGIEATRHARIRPDEPDPLDRVTAAFRESNRAGVAPRRARIVGDLQRWPPPGALPRHHQAVAAEVRDVVHLAALEK